MRYSNPKYKIMKTKVSKTLEAIFARTAFDLLKADIRHSYKDHLAVELLRNDTSLAYNILSLLLSPREIEWIATHICTQIERSPIPETLPIDEYLLLYRFYLAEQFAYHNKLSTIHLLIDICSENVSATAQTLERYDIKSCLIRDKFNSIIQHSV